METLGISASDARSENRLKSLFWPSVQNSNDVDYLGAQGFWVCTIVSVISLATLIVLGKPVAAVLVFLFYFLGGVGVRERSRYAAAAILTMYVIDAIAGGLGIVRIIIIGLLLSNLRATWRASGWSPTSDEAVMPPRFGDSWSDKLADQLPSWLWPKIRIVYYVFSATFMALIAAGLIQAIRQKLA
jgi:hypothetical protein